MRLRLQILTAAVVVAGGVCAGLVTFGDREPHFAGTNSTGTSAEVAALRAGQTLCVRDLWLPSDAAAASMVLGTGRARPTRVDLSLTTRGRRLRSSAYVSWAKGNKTRFPLTGVGRGGPARLCLRSRGPLGIVKGTQTEPFASVNYTPRLSDLGERPNATLGGRPISGLVAVRFLEADATSKLERLGDARRRASLFRSGWVGPWTYLVLLIAIPLLWVAGLVTLWRFGR